MTDTLSSLSGQLARVEREIVDWKRRRKSYWKQRLTVPKHIEDRLAELRRDAVMIRKQLGDKT